jgi:hypothetical protein
MFTVVTASHHTGGLAGLSAICRFQNLREAEDQPRARLSNETYCCQDHDQQKNRFFKGNFVSSKTVCDVMRLFFDFNVSPFFILKRTTAWMIRARGTKRNPSVRIRPTKLVTGPSTYKQCRYFATEYPRKRGTPGAKPAKVFSCVRRSWSLICRR